MGATDQFVGTWRDASPSSASQDFTLFIARAGSDYAATLYIVDPESGSAIIHVHLVRTGDELTGHGLDRTNLTIVRRKDGRIEVIGYGAPKLMVKASTATNPVFD